MAKRSNVESLLVRGLRDTFEPLVRALDQKPALLMEDSADTGSVAPSVRDSSLKILLGQMMQTIWRQNYGLIQTRAGNIPNNDDRMKRSMNDLQALQDEVQDGKTSMESKHAIGLLHWYGVNEARLDAYNEMLTSLATVYRDVFHEEWRPLVQAGTGVASAVSKTKAEDIPEAEKARLLELMARATERSKIRSKVGEKSQQPIAASA